MLEAAAAAAAGADMRRPEAVLRRSLLPFLTRSRETPALAEIRGRMLDDGRNDLKKISKNHARQTYVS